MDPQEDYIDKKLYETLKSKDRLELQLQLNKIHSNLYGTGNPEIDEAILDDKIPNFRQELKKLYKNGNKNN